ncbi:MAG: hypothetical protein ACJAVN_001310 [Roseivirga sp.]|jgi:hypothetical protein
MLGKKANSKCGQIVNVVELQSFVGTCSKW